MIGFHKNHHRRIPANNVARIRSKSIEKPIFGGSSNIIGRASSMVIPLLANQDLTPMLNGHNELQKAYSQLPNKREVLIDRGVGKNSEM